ncbi:hypothetical protein CC86DRAFT_280471 [Ophiobolus disseminans]|uniref:Ubiquitin-like domain-containing protein n=1 Tax=Ophiobolus disseminans TaxID=1469910 RepID=A0A6A7AHQ1_9PLEO|nr:hypothetical protein CC86DRAFT_280471 [Ophiobolus disseminans]
MTDTADSAPPPKKRSLFKRAAWQDAPKTDGEGDDMFSHANEFDKIVAEENRLAEEKRRKAHERKRKHDGQADRKQRKVSSDHDEPILPRSGSGSAARATRISSKARSRTPLSPAPSKPPPDSLSARYDTLTKSTSSTSHIIDLGDSDEDDDTGYNLRSGNGNSLLDYSGWKTDRKQDMAVRPLRPAIPVVDDDDDLEELLDPALATIAARARERAAASARIAANPTTGEPEKAPVIQLFVSPEIPDAKPLMVKVRIDSTLEKTRLAWCGKQGYSPALTKDILFTWKGTRVYDSTTIKRLGIEIDAHGNVSVQGDNNIYDNVNLPKVYVEAWTPQLFKQFQEQEAAEAAAKRKAAEPSPEIEARDPTPEPAPKERKFRLTMKAKGKEDFKLYVRPTTTFAHIASAYKLNRGVDESQPITLMFDGDRLAPMDIIADSELEDMDSIDVLFN